MLVGYSRNALSSRFCIQCVCDIMCLPCHVTGIISCSSTLSSPGVATCCTKRTNSSLCCGTTFWGEVGGSNTFIPSQTAHLIEPLAFGLIQSGAIDVCLAVMEPERMHPSQAPFPKISKTRLGRMVKRLCCCSDKESEGFTEATQSTDGSSSPAGIRSSLSNVSSYFRYSGRNLGIASAAAAMARNMQSAKILGKKESGRKQRKLMVSSSPQATSEA